MNTNDPSFDRLVIKRTGIALSNGQPGFIPAAEVITSNGSFTVYYDPIEFSYQIQREYGRVYIGLGSYLGTSSFSFKKTPSGVQAVFELKIDNANDTSIDSIYTDAWTIEGTITLTKQSNGLYTKEVFKGEGTEQTSINLYEGTTSVGKINIPIGSADAGYNTRYSQTDLDLNLSKTSNNQFSDDLKAVLQELWYPEGSYFTQPHFGPYSGFHPSVAVSIDSGQVNSLDITSNKTLIGIGSDHQATYDISLNNNQTEDITGSQVEITIPKGVKIVSTSLSITSRKQDTQGNTVLTVNPGTISGKSTLTKAITLEATGFSQPLNKLLNSGWDFNIQASATGFAQNLVVSDSVSTYVDSSKGLVEKLGKEFLDNLSEINQNLGKELNDIQKNLEKSFTNLVNLKKLNRDTSRFYPPDPLKVFSYGDLLLEKRKLEIQEALNGLQQKQQDILSQAKAKGVSLIESLISDAGDKWVLDGVKKYLERSIPNLPEGVSLNLQDGQLNVAFTSGNFTVTSNSSLPGLSQLGIDLVKSGRDGNVQPVIDRLKGIVADSRSKLDFKYNSGRFNANLTTNIENSSGKIVDSQADFSIDIRNGNDNGMLQGNINFDPGTQSFTYGGTGFYNLSETLKLEIGIQTTNQKPSVSLGVSGFLNKIQQFEDNSNNLPLFNNFRTLTENYDSETPQSSLLEFNLTNSNFTTKPLIERISYGTEGNQSNRKSEIAITSSNGQFIAFNSDATNLIANDIDDFTDSFVIDLQTNKTEIISVATDGTQGNGKSEVFAISADGRFVIFASDANNLVINDTNDVRDIFLRDRQNQTTELISKATDGSQANGISDLGNISADGRYAVFSSIASNLVAGDTNDVVDIFVRDLQQGTTERVSSDSNNVEANNDSLSSGILSISADGRYVVFNSYASNLINDDNNDTIDIFVRDRQTGTTSRINVSSDGTEANDISLSPAISADGRYVVFSSLASNLVAEDTNDTGDIFLYDQQTRSIELVSVASDEAQANNNSMSPSISADGRYIVFQSLASNLGVDNPESYSNIYLRDRLTGKTKLVSPSLNGETDGDSINPSISADGSYISFESAATNLVNGDTNDASDIFVNKSVTLENSDPVTQANKTLTVLEDAAPTSLAIATPTDADNDALTITVTAVPETTKGVIRLPNNTVVTANTSLTTEQLTSLVFAPVTNANGSAGTLSYTVSDGKGGTATQTITLEITAVNDAPILGNAIADVTATEDTAFSFTIPENTFTDVDAGDILSYSATLQDGSNLPSWLKFNPATRTFSSTPINANIGSLTIQVRATDNDGLIATDTFLLAIEQTNTLPTFKLSKIADDIFNVFDSSGKSKLQIILTERSSNLVNELGVFTVDDAQGNINGIAPGAAGYAQAALDRAKVIFSAIANLPNGFNTNNLTHLLEFNSGENLRFYLIRNSTTDAVLTGVTPLTEILFSDPLRQKITDLGSDGFSLAWKDKDGNSTTDFKDLVVKIQSTNDSLPLGTSLQGKFQGEMIDLRGVTSQVKADFVVNREAAFNNFIGFYQVADENGGIDTNSDGKADIFAGQAGYIEAAIRGRVAGIDLTVNNQGTATYTGTFQPGFIFAPFIIANGRPDALLDTNPNNNPAVYFPFLGANTDKVDHIRLLGNNVFGFEDLANGGDKDFNDVIVRVNLSIA